MQVPKITPTYVWQCIYKYHIKTTTNIAWNIYQNALSKNIIVENLITINSNMIPCFNQIFNFKPNKNWNFISQQIFML